MNIFVFFLWIYSGESAKVTSLPTTRNIDSEILSYLVHVYTTNFFEAD